MFPSIDEDEERRRQARQGSLRGMFRRGPYPQFPSTPPFVSPQDAPEVAQRVNPYVQAQQQAQQPAPVMGATPVAPVAQPDAVLPKDVPPEDMGGKTPGTPFSRRLNRPTGTVEEDEQRLRELEDKPEGFWKRLGVAATQGLRAATDQPITPIATRRDRDILKFQNRIKRGLDEQSRASQIESREAAMQAQQERLNQGAARFEQSRTDAERRAKQAEANALNRYYSGQTDFDPDDPANAPFVAKWERMFGFKPAKNVRGSQLQYRVGYDADGNPVAEVLHKGTGETTQQQGSKIVSTDPQLNRQQQATIATTNEQGRNQRSVAGIKSRERIAQMPPRGGGAKGGVKVNATHQAKAAASWKTLSGNNPLIDANEAEIAALDKMTDAEADAKYKNAPNAKWNTNETIKNQKLRQLGNARADYIKTAQDAAAENSALNSGMDFEVDAFGRTKRVPRAASDLDRPIYGKPTGNLQGAINAFKARAGREPTAQELENIKRVFRQ